MFRMLVSRCHVGSSNLTVIRYVISRLKNGYATFKALPKNERRHFMNECIKEHKENRELYNQVME